MKKTCEVEVVEETSVVARYQEAQSMERQVAKAIERQVRIVQGVELRGNFEKIKLGAMVHEAVTALKLDGKPERGRGNSGGGALGWWNSVCPKDKAGAPIIPYKTVMQWKEAAENLPEIMKKDPEKLIAALAKDPKHVLGKEKRLLTDAEKLANGMTFRQMLLWGGDEEARGKKPGRPVGSKADLTRKPDTTDAFMAARAVWSKIIVQANQTMVALESASKLLNEKDVEDALATLASLVFYLNERKQALKNGRG